MAEDGAVDLVRQVRAHLESLRAAGVLFVPRGPALAPLRVVVPRVATAVVATQGADAPRSEDPHETRRRGKALL